MKRVVRHEMVNLDRVRAAIDGAYKANVHRLSPYAPKLAWNGARLATMSITVMTKTINANFTITDQEVLIEGKVPFLFGHLEGRIITVLAEQLEVWLVKVRAEEPQSDR
jgi:hypothetical protein